MENIRCPHCGSPVIVKEQTGECGWCGDAGMLGVLAPQERAKIGAERSAAVPLRVTVTDSTPPARIPEPPRC